MKQSYPLISVIIPIHKFEDYVLLSIKSIQNQSYKNIEIIIIDDSIDNNLNSFLNKLFDNRIKCINGNKIGISDALNVGIENSMGEYIIRMDGDDISLPTRIEEQFNYLKKKNLDICGSNIQNFGISNEKIYFPEFDHEIRFSLMFGCPIAHPTVMVKTNIVKKFKYNINTTAAEDYELWIKLASQDYRFGNCQLFLLQYRTHKKQASKNNNNQLEKTIYFAKQYVISYLNLNQSIKFNKLNCGLSEYYSTYEVNEIINILIEESQKRGISGKTYERLLNSLYFRITDYSKDTLMNYKSVFKNNIGIIANKKMIIYLKFRILFKNSIPPRIIYMIKRIYKQLSI